MKTEQETAAQCKNIWAYRIRDSSESIDPRVAVRHYRQSGKTATRYALLLYQQYLKLKEDAALYVIEASGINRYDLHASSEKEIAKRGQFFTSPINERNEVVEVFKWDGIVAFQITRREDFTATLKFDESWIKANRAYI